MKKSIIALAVAGALAAPAVSMADATLYGRLHFQTIFADNHDVSIRNAGHRIGVKGESQMDSGLTAFYQLETEYGVEKSIGKTDNSDSPSFTANDGAPGANLNVRLAFAGVKGDFGTVTIGRLNNPYADIYTSDIWEYNSGIFEDTTFRLGSALTYATPDMNGFGAAVGVSAQGQGNDDQYNDADSWMGQVHYSANGFTAVAGYQTFNNADSSAVANKSNMDEDHYGLGLSYEVNNLLFAGYYEHVNVDERANITNGNTDHDNWELAAQYTLDKTKFALAYGEKDVDHGDDQNRVMVGVYQNLGGGADVYAEYGAYNSAAEKANTGYDNFVVGYRVKF